MFLLLYVMIAFLKKINHYNTHTHISKRTLGCRKKLEVLVTLIISCKEIEKIQISVPMGASQIPTIRHNID